MADSASTVRKGVCSSAMGRGIEFSYTTLLAAAVRVDVGTHTAYSDKNTTVLLFRIRALGGDGGQADQALRRESASMLPVR